MHRLTLQLTRAALFMALGVLLPIAFHLVGLGSIFLPMFWPVALCGFFIRPGFAFAAGLFTPILSHLLTGMPPIPHLYRMVFELSTLALLISVLRHRSVLGNFWILLAGLFGSLSAGLCFSAILARVLGIPRELYLISTLIKILPGIGLLLLVLPLLLRKIKALYILQGKDHVHGA